MNFRTYHQLQEITERTVLYWRSRDHFDPGDRLLPAQMRGAAHWTEDVGLEHVMEAWRARFWPNRVSRMRCVYFAVVPRSVYLAKGQLYKAHPRGNTFITNSGQLDRVYRAVTITGYRDWTEDDPREVYWIVDRIERARDKGKLLQRDPDLEQIFQTIEDYWNPPRLEDPKQIEVLAEGGVIIEAVDEVAKDIQEGDRVRFAETIVISNMIRTEGDAAEIPLDELQATLDDVEAGRFPGLEFVKDLEEKYGQHDLVLRIRPGTEGVATEVDFGLYRGPDVPHEKYNRIEVQIPGFPITLDIARYTIDEGPENVARVLKPAT